MPTATDKSSVKKPRAPKPAPAPATARAAKKAPAASPAATIEARPAAPAQASPATLTKPDKHTIRVTRDGYAATAHIGDCRKILPALDAVRNSQVSLVFADPPFNWNRAYDRWDDKMPEREYLDFTYTWINHCVQALRPGGSLWINIPDDWAAEITAFLKGRFEGTPGVPALAARMHMENWCIWHYRFGQNTTKRFINSKVHALHFVKEGGTPIWNANEVLEQSDRAAIYDDPRTQSKKDGMPPGLRVPMDVWYGQFWGRVQGNNKERRGYHDNQLPEVYLERVIRACSNEGDLVMDPFLGSGTTGVVALALNRNFIGTEFSPENAASACERIKLGPYRVLGQLKGASTAIFEHRRKSER
ncbi:MAG TPA: site-specific DNA-methyltransferase [Phycisphaerales bacterium]|nr:site-specific DNA-methyltransferase [Phycisphaerales bacterium]